MDEKWITVKEAAEQLRLDVSDVLRMIRSGCLKGSQIDGSWCVQRCDVLTLRRAVTDAPPTASEWVQAGMVPMDVPRIDLGAYEIDPDALALVPKDVCEKHRVVPVSRTGSTLIVAIVDADDPAAMDEIRFLTALRVEPVLASVQEIIAAIGRYYGGT